jgi:hypothetical protein
VTGNFPASSIAGRAHLYSGISPSFVLSVANDMKDFLLSILAALPVDVLCGCGAPRPRFGGNVRLVEVDS